MSDADAGEKLRVRFRKDGDLRLLSHHDLMRCTERMLRRADLPFRLTQGFHPTPRVVFAQSLPLGLAGQNEVVEIELVRPHTPADVLDRLNGQAPVGLTFTSARVVAMKASALPRRAEYRLPLPADRVADAAEACRELLDRDKVWVDKFHPRPRRVNLRPYLRNLTATADGLVIDVWIPGQGGARAETVVDLLGLTDLIAAGAVLERTELELHDEVPSDVSDGPPAGPPETARLEHVPATARDADRSDAPDRGPTPVGPVVE